MNKIDHLFLRCMKKVMRLFRRLKKSISLLGAISSFGVSCAQGIDSSFLTPMYEKPRPFSFITHIPADIASTFESPFEKRNLKPMLIVGVSTAFFLHFDQPIINSVGRTSKEVGLYPTPDFDNFSFHRKTILKWPDNLNSAFYQLGDGATTLELAGGFWLYGKITDNNRALQTASDLTETFLSMGISIQVLKRISGRQAPFQATVPGGRWRPFPSFSNYQHNTTQYDAFPSGHLATMMATVTVLADNYPEKKWIRPVGYLLTGLTGWSMMNNRVHWASDFPLGLAEGYLAAKITARHHHKNSVSFGN
jgi:membrane-associated phospholipid phosphatase